jgi:Nucleotidyl transferase AbiEii toxin, Type IV TA system
MAVIFSKIYRAIDRFSEDIDVTYDIRAIAPDLVIKIEFGARSTGEPTVNVPVSCDAAEHVAGVIFPRTDVRVMRVERTALRAWVTRTALAR